MEKRFESLCTYDLPICREYQRSQAGILPVETVLQLAAMFLFAAGVLFRLTMGGNETVNYAVMVMVLYFVMKDLASNGKREYKRMIGTNDGEAIRTSVTVAEDIHARNLDHGTSLRFKFEQVRHIGETKNLLILMMEQNQGVLIDKRTLVGGTREELIDVLFARCSGLKRKKLLNGTDAKIRKAIIVVLLLIYVIL